jgi:hypothetical protein
LHIFPKALLIYKYINTEPVVLIFGDSLELGFHFANQIFEFLLHVSSTGLWVLKRLVFVKNGVFLQ